MKITSRPRVILRRCSTYDVAKIRSIVRSGLEELALRPHGRTLIKPNVVASGPHFPHAYTRPEFVEGVIARAQGSRRRARERARRRRALRHHAPDPHGVRERRLLPDVPPDRGQALPLRGRAAGRDPAHARGPAARLPVHARAGREGRLLRELPQVQVAPVDHGDLLDEELHRDPGRSAPPHRSRSPAQREDRRPPVHHPAAVHRDRRHHRRRGPHAHAHAASTWASSSWATTRSRSTRCAARSSASIRGAVEHIRLASERGFGPMDLGEIEITRRRHARGGASSAPRASRSGLIRVEKYFEGTNITAYAGPPPEPERTDYCWGGCPGRHRGGDRDPARVRRGVRREDAAHARRVRRLRRAASTRSRARRSIFIGDCAKYKGEDRRSAGQHREPVPGAERARTPTPRSTTTSSRRW